MNKRGGQWSVVAIELRNNRFSRNESWLSFWHSISNLSFGQSITGFCFIDFFFQDQFQMKAWVLLLVLIPLITFSNGRTRFRMVEYDEDQGHSRAYGVCMRQCKRECLNNEGECKHHPQTRELICRQGPKDGDWNGFKTFMDKRGVTKCEDFLELKPALKEDETKSKHLSFQPSEIWQLFEWVIEQSIGCKRSLERTGNMSL